MHRRVVITGLGVVAPNGIGKDEFWRANVAGHSGIRRITRFDPSLLPTQIAGEVPDFDPEALEITPEERSTVGRGTQFALGAAHLALQDAKLLNTLGEEEREATGVFIGAAMASIDEGEKLWIRLTGRGTHPVQRTDDDPIAATLLMTHSPASAIASHHQLYGPCMVIATGCSAGGDAIGEAFLAIQEGRAERMLAGGSDASISYSGLNVFCVIGAMSTRNDAPERASRPYDGNRDGFVMGEGAAVLVLEEREVALARNAYIYAEVLSFASNCNAHHMTALPPDGAPLQNLLRQALEEAEISGADLNYINSHGSSTPSNEVSETAAYKAVFGEQAYHIPISATKSMIGHTQGAASAIEALVTALVLDQQIIPPTINQEQPDPRCDLDYVPNVARPATVNVALTHSSGFGGVNSALVLARAAWADATEQA
ncbi:MAG TPA: beta-ketoacyl-[acyl-carrier-protein] synthase family protein [Ktedonobacteraceae bacterium]|nr:beta-ketoacyl-[acyl-carrier-protein] synthase family protein [Ktedonobacteraceae bacterium]